MKSSVSRKMFKFVQVAKAVTGASRNGPQARKTSKKVLPLFFKHIFEYFRSFSVHVLPTGRSEQVNGLIHPISYTLFQVVKSSMNSLFMNSLVFTQLLVMHHYRRTLWVSSLFSFTPTRLLDHITITCLQGNTEVLEVFNLLIPATWYLSELQRSRTQWNLRD